MGAASGLLTKMSPAHADSNVCRCLLKTIMRLIRPADARVTQHRAVRSLSYALFSR